VRLCGVVAFWILIASQKPAVTTIIPSDQLANPTFGTLLEPIAIDRFKSQIVAGNVGKFADISRRLPVIRKQKHAAARASQGDVEEATLSANSKVSGRGMTRLRSSSSSIRLGTP
jgi:hypothetical protein